MDASARKRVGIYTKGSRARATVRPLFINMESRTKTKGGLREFILTLLFEGNGIPMVQLKLDVRRETRSHRSSRDDLWFNYGGISEKIKIIKFVKKLN